MDGNALPRRLAVGVAVLLYAWWAVTLPPFSGAATLAVSSAGLAGAGWGLLRRRPQPARRSPGRALPWAGVALAGGLWQLSAYLQQPRSDHPTISYLTNLLLDSHAARAAAFALWLLAAAELGRR